MVTLFFYERLEGNLIKIIKVFNNNVSLVLNDDSQEEVVMGSGIGFALKPGDIVDQSKIEKRFIMNDKRSISDMEQLIERIEYQDFELASEILMLFEKEFQVESQPTAVLTLADHLGFAKERAKKKMLIRTPLEWELKQVYPKEYQVALNAVALMREQTAIEIPDEEAAFITLHYVNSFEDSQGMEETMLISKIMQSILTIVNYHYKKEFKQDSLYFSRFVTHIRYFVKRQLEDQRLEDETSNLLNLIQLKYQEDFECGKKIKTFLEDTYGWKITEDELLYMVLHLNRLAS